MNALAMERFFSSRGVAIECVGDGVQAVTALKEELFDVVLLDINLPNMDGIQVLRAIRNSEGFATPKDVPVFAVTAFSDENDRSRFIAMGFTAFYSKPINMNELSEAIESLLEVQGGPQ